MEHQSKWVLVATTSNTPSADKKPKQPQRSPTVWLKMANSAQNVHSSTSSPQVYANLCRSNAATLIMILTPVKDATLVFTLITVLFVSEPTIYAKPAIERATALLATRITDWLTMASVPTLQMEQTQIVQNRKATLFVPSSTEQSACLACKDATLTSPRFARFLTPTATSSMKIKRSARFACPTTHFPRLQEPACL